MRSYGIVNRRTISRRIVIGSMLVVWLPGASGFAETFSECAVRGYAQDVAAKQDWHRGLRDLIVKARPDLEAPATLDMEQQLALVDRRQAQFSYLVRSDARRIRTGEGLPTFRNFDWTDADALALRRHSPSYVAIERKVADLDRQTKGRSDWTGLQQYSRTVLAVSPQFQELLKRLEARESAIEQLLKGCQPSR